MKNVFLFIAAAVLMTGCIKHNNAGMVTTTEKDPWITMGDLVPDKSSGPADVFIDTSRMKQTIEGFGSCFNELGWTSLSQLKSEDRESVMKELFAPGEGADFNICRMPVGANDFSVNWYSYNETNGDFDMKNFSIANDKSTLIPFIKNALKYNPSIKIWASPWSPPSWMKYNKHYASRSSAADRFATMPDPKYMNDLPLDREGKEGTDMFIQEDKYLKAYALYFSGFIEGYEKEGINIYAVMPQNEFNSAQIFPSCCWKASSLANFTGKYLGPAMQQKGVDILFGTMERPNEALVDTILRDPVASKYVKGVGFQWAGKDALPGIWRRYPGLTLYQSEQECGDGKNDWKGALHAWDLMKHYLNNGVSVYEYWNTSLVKGGISRWGWSQNSLVVVDPESKTFNYTIEYYIIKHISHFVKPGAKKLETGGEYKDLLAFLNPDKSVVVIIANQLHTAKDVKIRIGDKTYQTELKPDSFSTITMP
jgi:glucosylceramidase